MANHSLSKQQIYHQLNQIYSLKKYPIHIGDKSWEIYSVENIDDLLNAHLAKGENHEDILDDRTPYWADLWPSAIALAEYILENPSLLERKKVLEIGCGLGLSGMAAATITQQVVMTDYLPDTFPFIQLNWLHNLGKYPNCKTMDWRYPDEALSVDILLAADVAYEERAFEPLLNAFKQLVNPGGMILLSEPGRNIAKRFLADLPTHGFHLKKIEKSIHTQDLVTKVGIYQLAFG